MLRTVFVAFFAVVSLGCGGGSDTGTITGRVTHAGKPIKGTITFILATPDALPLTFPLDENGNYKAENVPHGKLLISIVPDSTSTGAVASSSKAKEQMGNLEAAGQPIPRELIQAANPSAPKPPGTLDPKYMDPMTSELVLEFETPTLEHNIEIR